MKGEPSNKLKLRIGLVIKMCIEDQLKIHKENLKKGLKDSPSLSYTSFKLAANSDVRPATISAILNGDSFPRQETLFDIISAFNLSYTEFAAKFDKISEQQLEEYAKLVANERRKKKKKS